MSSSIIQTATRLTTSLLLIISTLQQTNKNHDAQCKQTPNNNQHGFSSPSSSSSYMMIPKSDLRLAHSLLLASSSPATTISPPAATSQAQEAPDFTEPIGNHTVALGRDAQLSCKIRNLGNFRTAWLRVEDKGILTIHNNIITRNYRIGLTNNDDGKNFILTIKNVQPSDRGGYMCQINSVPMKYAIGYLDILTPPAFNDQPLMASTTNAMTTASGQPMATEQAQQTTTATATSVVTMAEGGNATLSCKATGHPDPVITWRREDNEPIILQGPGPSIESAVSKIEGSSIHLSSVSRLSSGAYLCIASNNVQPSASRRQVLDVQFSPVVRLPQTEVGAHLGQQLVRLTCHVELNPLGGYHWVKLTNSAGSGVGSNDNRQQFTQQQQQPAAAANEFDDLSLIEHDELINSDKFEIVIKQVNSDRIQMTLAIRHIERQDFAWYKCIGRNSLGTQSNSIRLYETSSFSLNNMFRGSSSSDGNQFEPSTSNEQLRQQQQQNNNNNQHLNDQQHQDTASGSGNGSGSGKAAAKPVLSRTHTRSSWVQRSSSSSSSGGQQQDQGGSLIDSAMAPGSPAISPILHLRLLTINHYLAPILLLCLNLCYLLTLLA